MRFADYWYYANGIFTDLKELCTNISQSAGLDLDADGAFRWLATGGFATEFPGFARAITFALSGVKSLTKHFSGGRPPWQVEECNTFVLNLDGAIREEYPLMEDGRIVTIPCYRRGAHILPIAGVYGSLLDALPKSADAQEMMEWARYYLGKHLEVRSITKNHVTWLIEGLEAMIAEGWVSASVNRERPTIGWQSSDAAEIFHTNEDNVFTS